jgi:subtilase family serine protease
MLSRFSLRYSLCGVIASMAVLLPLAALGQVKPLITAKIDASERASLTRSIPARVAKATDLGRVAPNLPMNDMLLMLQSSDAQNKALESFLSDVQNPASPNYHKFLSPTEFGTAYGPAQADVDTIAGWLTSQGFKVEHIAAARNWIRFSGTAVAVETAFGTEIHSYQEGNAKRISNSTELSIPRALAPVVSGVLSVNNFEKPSLHTPIATVTRNAEGKLMRVSQAAQSQSIGPDGKISPQYTSQGQPEENYLAPGDFAKIYNSSSIVAAGNNGAGVSIAIVGRSDISLSDVETFRTLFKLPYNDPTFINANADPGVVSGDDEEAILDVEWSGAVAPMAQIQYVIGATTSTTDGIDISAAYIVDNKIAPIMSLSFGECEQLIPQSELLFYNSLWQQASAEGISVLVSAGDNGASGCLNQDYNFATKLGFGVSGLASTPYDTAVGGTEFNDPVLSTYWSPTIHADQSSALGYIPEFVWNESCNTYAPSTLFNCYFEQSNFAAAYAGSGGASTCSTHGSYADLITGLYTCTSGYPKPSWQSGTGVPADGARDIPDVALAAAGGHDGFLVCYDGSCQYTVNLDGSFTITDATLIGGTSASSPSMAGILALVEQKSGQYQGLANYKLYSLANNQTGNCNSSLQTDPTKASTCVFNDVTQGSNSLTCQGNLSGCTVSIPGVTTYKQLSGWSAGAGYDLATGLGSVNVANLVTAWANLTQTSTSTSLSLSATTFTHGTPVTVTSTVMPSSGAGVPTGSLSIEASGNTSSVGPVVSNALTAGAYTGSVTNLPGGTYAVTAQYGGDASYSGSTSSPVNVTVAPEPSVMSVSTLILFANGLGGPIYRYYTSSALNTNWYISLTMAGASGAGVPTGTVTITQGTTNVGTFTLDKTGAINVACGAYTSCDFPLGTYTFTATYSGDSSFSPSTKTFPFTITKGTAYWSINASQQVVTTGTPITATVYMAYDPAVVPTGTVSLIRTDTNAVLGTGTINASGTAVVYFNAPAGSYDLDITWPGDVNYKAGYFLESVVMTVTAPVGIATTAALTPSSTTSSLGKSTSFSVTVKPASTASNGAVPTGTVTVYSLQYGQIAAVGSIVGGNATFFVPWPVAGPESVYAVYSGDANYAGSTTATATITVAQATPSLSITALAPYVAIGGRDSITALLTTTVSATAPTGTIQFYDALNGAASVALGTPQALNTGNGGTLLATLAPALAAGTHVITAIYSGDANWTATTTTGSVKIVSQTPDFTLTGPSTLTITAGQTANVALSTTSLLGFATPIAVSCSAPLPEGISCGTATITPGSNGSLPLISVAPGTVKLAVNTPRSARPWQLPGAIVVAGIVVVFLPRRRRIGALAALSLVASLAMCTISGCGGNTGAAAQPSVTSLSVTSANSKVASGTTVTFNAQVTGTTNITGTITFYDAGTVIGTGSLSSGIAQLTTSTLAVGTHAITASYSGDNNNQACKSSDVLNQTITGSFNLTVTATAGALTHTTVVPTTLQ